MKRSINLVKMLIAVVAGYTLVAETTEFTWTGVTGNWLTETNWTPSGFENNAAHSCIVTSGTAQSDGTTF